MRLLSLQERLDLTYTLPGYTSLSYGRCQTLGGIFRLFMACSLDVAHLQLPGS
jgi:hypothetical protein